MKNILLIGKPRVGKTTLVIEVIKNLRDRCAGGFYTQEIREGGKRKGFSIKTLGGKEGILAHEEINGKYRVGKYGINISDLEELAVKSVEKAIEENDIVVIDEVGKMELYSDKFKEAVIRALNSPKPVLSTIPIYENKFINSIKARKDSKLMLVTPENRDLLVEEIVQRLIRFQRTDISRQKS